MITRNEISQVTSDKIIEENDDHRTESPKTKELLRVLKQDLCSWSFDPFHFNSLTNGWPLTTIGYTIFTERHLLQNVLKVEEGVLLRFLTTLERSYHADNPYHNNVHAADVMQTTHILLKSTSLKTIFTEVEVCTALFAAAIHDVDHPGLTNQYLINTSNDLAMLYNDNSVLENHHLSTTFKILRDPRQDIFQNLPAKMKQSVRKLSIDMVLATDMSKHMDLIADLKTMVETKKISSATGAGGFQQQIIQPENPTDRVRILKNMLHCADLSNPTKPYHIYERWSKKITEEFFHQGDLERSQGIDVSPMCDRHTVNFENSQLGFIDFVVHPLWEIWNEVVYPDGRYVLDQLAANRMALEERKEAEINEECSRIRRTQSDPMRTSYDADNDDDDEDESDEIGKDDIKGSNATRCRPSRREGGRRLGVANQPMIKHPAMITSRKSKGGGGDQVVDTTTLSASTASSTASTSMLETTSASAIPGDSAAASSGYTELGTATATEAAVATAESEKAGPSTDVANAASETIAAQLHDLRLH